MVTNSLDKCLNFSLYFYNMNLLLLKTDYIDAYYVFWSSIGCTSIYPTLRFQVDTCNTSLVLEMKMMSLQHEIHSMHADDAESPRWQRDIFHLMNIKYVLEFNIWNSVSFRPFRQKVSIQITEMYWWYSINSYFISEFFFYLLFFIFILGFLILLCSIFMTAN